MGYSRILWNNLAASATITSSAADSGFPASNVADWRDVGDIITKATNVASYWIKLAWADPVTIAAIALAGHNFYSQDVTGILFEVSDDDAIWTTLEPSFTAPNNFALAKFPVSLSKRYLRMTLSKATNFSPQIGVLFAGSYLEIPSLPSLPADPDACDSVSSLARGGQGHYLGVIHDFTMRTTTWLFKWLEQSWIVSTWKPFWDAHRFLPFFFAWNWDNFPLEIYLMWMKDPSSKFPYDNYYRSLSFELEGRKEE